MRLLMDRGCSIRTLACLAILAAGACSTEEGPLVGTPDGETLFLTAAAPQPIHMQALYEGRVQRDEQGCLRLETQDRHVVVWPFGFELENRGGATYVEDPARRAIGRIGGSFRFGGGEVPSVEAADLSPDSRALAQSRCPGRYWIVGGTNLRQ